MNSRTYWVILVGAAILAAVIFFVFSDEELAARIGRAVEGVFRGMGISFPEQ